MAHEPRGNGLAETPKGADHVVSLEMGLAEVVLIGEICEDWRGLVLFLVTP